MAERYIYRAVDLDIDGEECREPQEQCETLEAAEGAARQLLADPIPFDRVDIERRPIVRWEHVKCLKGTDAR